MPTRTTHRLDDFQIDTAQLGAPLPGDTLDALSDVIDARNAARDLTALTEHAQTLLESGANPYQVREQFAVDLEMAAAALRHALAAILGADGVA